MKTAILYTGHMRTFAECLPTHQWHVLRHHPGADIYVSTVADAAAEAARSLVPTVKFDVVAAQPDCVAEIAAAMGISTAALCRYAAHAPYELSVSVQAVLAQLWQLRQGWRLIEASGQHYDCIIRIRPDIWFQAPLQWSPPHEAEACTPWWGRFGGVNDRLAIMGPLAAEAYCTTYDRIPALLRDGCPLHPESLVLASLTAADCTIVDHLDAVFATLRAAEHPGQSLTYRLRFPEIQAIDIAHHR